MKPCGIHRGRCLAGVALLAVLRLGACEVLSIQTSPPQDLEAVVANWNVGLDDAGAPPFAGHLRFSGAFCEGGRVDVSGTLALIDSAACDDLVQTTHRLAEAGAIGVIFFYHEHGLGGLALGDAAPPTIRAVLIERDPGLEVAKLLTLNQAAIFAELKPGKLISEDAYEEQFIFRVDEFLATRKENFLWHRYPSLLRSTGRETLSARLMPHLQMPKGWFSRPMGFVPLFNPSLLSLSDGTFLVALRMSNGQGCPSVRAARESSMDTRVCRNELVLAHLAKDFSVQSHVLVEMPKLSCYFTSETQTAGRQFLDEVHGPMDARIAWGADEIWVLFYAERNRDQEVERGMHAAPLHISWEKCSGWVMHSNDAVFAPSQCQWLGTGHAPHTLSNCQASCDAKENCDAFSFREGAACELRHCLSTEPEVWRIDGWQSWRRGAPKCLQHAWVKEEELLVFPAAAVEKNWNLIEGRRDRLFLEYFIEPHIVLTAHLHRHDAGLTMTALEQSFVARWPYEVLHGLTNVRGGFCCLRLPQELLEAHQLFAEPWWSAEEGEDVPAIPKGALRLGAGHLQRIRSPFDQAPGDLSRFRRQAKSRTYHQFFYLVRDSEPFDVVAVSPEWCITINGHFSQHWAEVLSPGEEACESIQFVAGLALRSATSGSEVVVSYGINDCESDLLPLAVSQVLAMLRPVTSDVNASLDDLEMI